MPLKYRIAFTIFLLEAIMLAVVLYQTASYATSQTKLEIERLDDVVLLLLMQPAHAAMLFGEYDDFQATITAAVVNPHISGIQLIDVFGRVVASNDLLAIGDQAMEAPIHMDHYHREFAITGRSGNLGRLTILFSEETINRLNLETLNLGAKIAFAGMLIIALAGLLIGIGLSRRLVALAEVADKISAGEIDLQIEITGEDEIGRLGQSLNSLVNKLHTTIIELQVSEERYRNLVNHSPDLVWQIDTQGVFTYLSPSLKAMTGFDSQEIIGTSILDLFSGDAKQRIGQLAYELFQRGSPEQSSIELIHNRKDGSQFSGEVHYTTLHGTDGKIVGIQGITRDITERRKMEEELQKMEKLESIGVLAGGIAHDLNNFLTGIVGHISLARMSINPADKGASLEAAERAAMQVKDLTQQLLTFSKGGAPMLQNIDI